jgi:hypothetical protein
MAAVHLRMHRACEQHLGNLLLRVRMHVQGDNGLEQPGHTVRDITRARHKVCSVLTMQLIRQRTLTAKVA